MCNIYLVTINNSCNFWLLHIKNTCEVNLIAILIQIRYRHVTNPPKRTDVEKNLNPRVYSKHWVPTQTPHWRLQESPLRIDQDVDQNVEFYLKHRVATPCFEPLTKVSPLWRLQEICEELIKILNEICSFIQKIGLPPELLCKNESYCEGCICIC